jgi:hypothetical protein
MPTYTYRCACGAVRDQFASVEERNANIPDCHGPMVRQMQPAMVSVQADMHARSPIDGTPLTSRRQRSEYMKRNDLQEALPASEVIRATAKRKAENERLAAQLPQLAEPLKRELYEAAGMA